VRHARTGAHISSGSTLYGNYWAAQCPKGSTICIRKAIKTAAIQLRMLHSPTYLLPRFTKILPQGCLCGFDRMAWHLCHIKSPKHKPTACPQIVKDAQCRRVSTTIFKPE